MRRRRTIAALGSIAGGAALVGRRPGPAGAQGPAAVTGEVLYRERILPPPGARVTVQLQDVSRADAPAVLVAEETIDPAGAGPPYAFSLPYDPARLDPRFTYAVRAEMAAAGRLIFATTERYPVITQGAPTSGLTLLLQMVSGGGPGPAGDGLRARDGQHLGTQPAEVQAAFRTQWGAEAEAHWVAEHEAELARQGR